MITFPNAKINLGLSVLGKRNDGFHNLETIFYPVPVCDILEIIEFEDFFANQSNKNNNAYRETTINLKNGFVALFSNSGNFIGGEVSTNLVVKALLLFDEKHSVNKNIKIHLHKIIPSGAGLGGGSSNAVFTLKMLDEITQISLTKSEMLQMAEQLGSDCPFFVTNSAAFASGRGEILTPNPITLKGNWLVLIKPDCSVHTAEAFSGVRFSTHKMDWKALENQPIANWNHLIQNDFEYTIFRKYPQIEKVKNMLIEMGATYASMSGSGSAVYGIYNHYPDKINVPDGFSAFVSELR
jgi:4-diphosphocytidyl-2-C-methyl-D-erythritol kinase